MFIVVVAAAATGACQPRIVTVSRAVPIDLQLKLSHVSRVWVAGFHVTESRDVDLNVETVNLVRDELKRTTSLEVIDVEPLLIPAEDVFGDRRYWQRLASEHGSPLIVTGTVNFLVAPAKTVQKGRNTYVSAAGRVLDALVVILDGRTGEPILTKRLARRTQYGIGRFALTLPLYFQLMRRGLPEWMDAIAAGASESISNQP